MTEISFYHLTSTPLEKALPKLMEKVFQTGKPALLLAESAEKGEVLCNLLWSYTTKVFLPHGTEKDGFSEQQPIYITAREEDNPNNATILAVTDGRIPESIENFERCLDLFDGNDEASLGAARERFKTYKARGFTLSYWKQTPAGGWEKGN